MDPVLIQEIAFGVLVLAVVLFWYCTGGAAASLYMVVQAIGLL